MTVLFLSVRTLNWSSSSSSFITVSQYFSVSALTKKGISVSARTVRNIITVSQYFSVSALAKKQYLYQRALFGISSPSRSTSPSAHWQKNYICIIARTVRNIITVSQYFSVSALPKKYLYQRALFEVHFSTTINIRLVLTTVFLSVCSRGTLLYWLQQE
jgi:hypothetical protein